MDELTPGAVCPQWKKCGRARCKCAAGQLHGPYYYRFYRVDGRLCKEYVRKADLAAVRASCAKYRGFWEQVRENNKKWSGYARQLREVEAQWKR